MSNAFVNYVTDREKFARLRSSGVKPTDAMLRVKPGITKRSASVLACRWMKDENVKARLCEIMAKEGITPERCSQVMSDCINNAQARDKISIIRLYYELMGVLGRQESNTKVEIGNINVNNSNPHHAAALSSRLQQIAGAESPQVIDAQQSGAEETPNSDDEKSKKS